MARKSFILAVALTFITHADAMEMQPAQHRVDQQEPLLAKQKLVTDLWNEIASYLPGNDAFLNRLVRVINLNQKVYEKILKAFLAEQDPMPLAMVCFNIGRHFRTNKLQNNTYKMTMMKELENIVNRFDTQPHLIQHINTSFPEGLTVNEIQALDITTVSELSFAGARELIKRLRTTALYMEHIYEIPRQNMTLKKAARIVGLTLMVAVVIHYLLPSDLSYRRIFMFVIPFVLPFLSNRINLSALPRGERFLVGLFEIIDLFVLGLTKELTGTELSESKRWFYLQIAVSCLTRLGIAYGIIKNYDTTAETPNQWPDDLNKVKDAITALSKRLAQLTAQERSMARH